MAAKRSHSCCELRIVLLGNRASGKSSAGNTILGREEFDPDVKTLQCVKRQGEVVGKHLTVVDTPGWKDYNLILKRDTPNLLKQEIIRSVGLCLPGPHAVLLVIHDDMTFTEAERNALSNHLSLLGRGAWKHSIVLFIQETLDEEKTFEIKGKMLQWLVEKCENRYHVLNINNKNNTQVTQLLEKIEEMVRGNGHVHYEIDRRILEETEKRRRTDEEKAQARRREIQRNRKQFNRSRGQLLLPQIRIVLLGHEDAGKSSAGNIILGRESQPGQRSAVCVKREEEVAGRYVTVVDAPGWLSCTYLKYSLELTKREIVLSQGLCGKGPHCFLLVIGVDTHFKGRTKKTIQQHLELLTERVWEYTMVLFTYGDWLGDITIEQFIESEGEHLKSLVDKCKNRYHVLNKHRRSDVKELLEKIEEMVAQNSGRLFEMNSQDLLEKKEREEERARDRKRKKQREHLQSLKEKKFHLSNLRIILLGSKHVGKTSAVNTILGRDYVELCKNSRCIMTEGDVAGRQVTLVDAPGWWIDQHCRNNSELIKQEMRLCVSLCPPGPHAVLLLIRLASSFTVHMGIAAKEHVELLGREVWNHTMVLFTHGDWLGDTTIEQYIESEGEPLQSLLDKCGNRYHVLSRGNVTELLEKIELMVAGNYFEMNIQVLHDLQERKKKVEERARDRRMKVQRQREHLQLLQGVASPTSELRVMLLGNHFVGKTSSGNTILGRDALQWKEGVIQCLTGQGEVAGRQVTIVKVPKWKTHTHINDTPELTKLAIVGSVCVCPPGPHAVILVVDGSHSLTEFNRENLQDHLELLSKSIWNHTMVLFTFGDMLGDATIEQHIESELELQALVEKCGNRYHVFNNLNRGDDFQVMELLEKIEEMVTENGCYFEMDRKILEHVQKKIKQQTHGTEDRCMKAYKNNATLKFALGDIQPLKEVGIVLLGCRRAGKTSARNTILGREETSVDTSTAKCVRREGERSGRKITVVEAPSWKKYQSVKDTAWLIKKEINHSVSLCPPGPYAFLLVIHMESSVTEKYCITVQEHLKLLGENAWDHTLIAFTHGDWLDGKPIEQYIESEKHLRYLVEKCGNRYHVLNNRDKSDTKQVTELLEKIEEMVATTNQKNLMASLTADDCKGELEEGREYMKEEEMEMSRSMAYSALMSDDDGSSLDYPAHPSQYAQSEWGSVMSEKSDLSCHTQTSAQSSGYWSFKSHGLSQGTGKKRTQEKLRRKPALSELALLAMEDPEHSTSKGDVLASEVLCQDHKPTNGFESCKDVNDTPHWRLMEPSVSKETDVPVYKLSCSSSGSFECTISGLRWVCAGEVTLKYTFSDPDIFRGELAMLQYEPIGPLMDIKVLSGELLEAHLPHFACLEESDSSLRDTARVLHGGDSGVILETCEMTRFHAKLFKPSFSLTVVLMKTGLPIKTHLEVLIYRTRVRPLVLLTYVVPRDASMIQAVEKDVSKSQDAKEIKTHRPDMPLRMNTKFCLNTSHNNAKTSPSEITLKYIRPPDLFRMVIENAEDSFDIELVSERKSIWKATLETFEFGDTEVASNEAMCSEASRYSREIKHGDQTHTSTAARASEEEGKMAAVNSSKDQLSCIRPGLIERTSEGVLKSLLLRLESHQPPVVNSMEAQVILQKNAMLQDQVTSLIDMMLKKGDEACEVMLSLLKELDNYLYRDLGL